jgi:flavin reductase (DIM6/NTAB) family NADH-FMN oxidoreductase RutF
MEIRSARIIVSRGVKAIRIYTFQVLLHCSIYFVFEIQKLHLVVIDLDEIPIEKQLLKKSQILLLHQYLHLFVSPLLHSY